MQGKVQTMQQQKTVQGQGNNYSVNEQDLYHKNQYQQQQYKGHDQYSKDVAMSEQEVIKGYDEERNKDEQKVAPVIQQLNVQVNNQNANNAQLTIKFFYGQKDEQK